MTLALSVRQPWAWAITAGIKPVENRTWPTKVRGRVLIHAGVRWDDGEEEGMRDIRHWCRQFDLPVPDRVDLGGIVGEAEIIDCVTDHPSEFFMGPYGFVLRNAKPLPFRPLKGRLGFFEVEE